VTRRDHARADRLLMRTALHGGVPLAVLAVSALGLAAAEIAFPAVLGRGIDAAVGGGGSDRWLVLAGLLVAAIVLLDTIEEISAGSATARSTAWLRKLFVRRVLEQGPRATEQSSAGDLLGRLVGNCSQAAKIGQVVVRSVAALVPALGAPVALALIDPWLCVTFLAGVPVLTLLLRALARDAQDFADRYLAAQGEIAGRLVDALAGVRSIAAAGTVERESERVLEPLPELHRQGMGVWRTQMRIIAQDGILVALLEVAVLSVAGLELTHGRISAGQLMAASQYVLLGAGITSVLSWVTAAARARAAAGRIDAVIARPAFAYGAAALPEGGGRLELRHVSVRDGTGHGLVDVSLEVEPGTFVAVVGPSGAGKSLLAAVAGRLREPDEGEVLLDGVPLRELDRLTLRGAVTYAFERPALVGGTFGDTIKLGTGDAGRRELVAAAQRAHADHFIRRLPRRYRTLVADAPLSGGELQRVGLARAFAHGGRLMILGDVAASLDTITEQHISSVLTGPLGGRTRLIVARRASTAARADRVVWLEHGSIRAIGTHAELWLDPDYRALFGADEEPVFVAATNGSNGSHSANGAGER
jgi:ATP-binding cassette, subfamily B, bacterial